MTGRSTPWYPGLAAIEKVKSYPPVIGLSGYAQAGKDTVAGILHDLYGYELVSFADVVREFSLKVNPIVGVVLPKEPELRPGFVNLSDRVEEVGWETAKTGGTEVRRILQNVGLAAREMFGEDVWVNAAFERAPKGKLLVVKDMRYPNEWHAVKDRGGQCWRIDRPDHGPANNHISEVALDSYTFDVGLYNEGTVRELAGKVMDRMDGR